ncbi:MAG: VTT domain-containing protein [Oscillospiraceae bacterium]|nr:VTT domain-containing protein [Oscillospiraceae bacterium]
MVWLRKNIKWIRIVLLIGLAALLIPFARELTVENIVQLVEPSLPLAILVFAAIYMAKALVTMPPLTVLYIATGIVFPVGLSIALNYAYLALMVSVGYLAGRIMSQEKVRKLVARQKKFAVFFDAGQKGSLPTLCFVSRFLPAPVNDLFSIFFGALGMPYQKFLIFSLLGLTPYMLLVVLTAASADDPLSVSFVLPLVLCVVLSVASSAFYKRKIARDAAREKLETDL